MYSAVFMQFRTGYKSFATTRVITDERFFTSMGSHMNAQNIIKGKVFATPFVRTLKGPLSGMDLLMPFEIIQLGKTFHALFAFMIGLL